MARRTVRTIDPGTNPEVVEVAFAGELWHWRGPSPYHFITVPDEACVGLRAVSAKVSYGWGMIPVNVRIGETVWTTSLYPKDGLYVLPVKDAVRQAERLGDGDHVAVEITIRT